MPRQPQGTQEPEVIIFTQVSEVTVSGGYLHFKGREGGDEENMGHHLNLDDIRRYKQNGNDTLTVYFKSSEVNDDEVPE